jgi:hypothetical protein
MTLTNAPPDLGVLRGLSQATLRAFNVRNNGSGWEYDTKCMDGTVATRWKSYHSTRPEGDTGWRKYLWIPEKPPAARYFYPPRASLKQAVEEAHGALYLVGGDIGVMSLYDAGLKNVTCTFGDSGIPATLADDLKTFGVGVLYLLPDRDKSGETWACKLRDALKDELDMTLIVQALPYPVEPSHGKDVNDLWLEMGCDPAAFRAALTSLPAWRLPEPEPAPIKPFRFEEGAPGELPAAFIDVIERALGEMGGFNTEGWSRKHVRCPFHDDATPSANWNNQKHILRCQSACGQSYLAKEVGEALGVRLADYYERAPLKIAQAVEMPAPKVVATIPATAPKQLRPTLPDFAKLTPEQEAEGRTGRKWLDGYLSYAGEACPLTPDILHEGMALWLLATAATRRMKFGLGGIDIYPNLYILIVATTSLYRKTTAMEMAKKVLRAANLESLLLPEDATPEALFDELAGVKPANFDSMMQEDKNAWLLGRSVAAQRAIMRDECSALFGLMKKDYNAGLTELLLQGYDSNSGRLRKQLKSKGLITVRDLSLSFLGATTPFMLGKYMSDEEQQNGFKARFAIITPDGPPVWRDVAGPVGIPALLTQQLRRMFMDILPWHNGQRPGGSSMLNDVISPPVTQVQASAEAVRQMQAYSKATSFDLIQNRSLPDGMTGNYARLGTQLVKVAMLMAAVEAEELPIRVEARHVYAAQEIVERWRESLHRLQRDIARSHQNVEEKVLDYLRSAGEGGASLRDIKRDCGFKQNNMAQDALVSLGEEGVIEQVKMPAPGGKGGRPSVRYRMVQGVS